MCELTQPTPGVILDVIHPNFGWLIGVGMMLRWIDSYVQIRAAKDGRDLFMSATTARRLALIAGVLLLVSMAYVSFIWFPSLAGEHAVAPPDCIFTFVGPEGNAALQASYILVFLFFSLAFVGGILLEIARWGRGVYPWYLLFSRRDLPF